MVRRKGVRGLAGKRMNDTDMLPLRGEKASWRRVRRNEAGKLIDDYTDGPPPIKVCSAVDRCETRYKRRVECSNRNCRSRHLRAVKRPDEEGCVGEKYCTECGTTQTWDIAVVEED